MDYIKKLERLDKHLDEHPKDYQAVISRLKTYSNAINHTRKVETDERLKSVAEYRRALNEKRKQH